MTLVNLPGYFHVPLGPNHYVSSQALSSTTVTIDAANEASMFIGHVVTSDGGSHTIDTTGSSSLQWRTGTVVFANAGTTVKVGLAAVDMGNGPPARAVNVTNVITFDVARSMTGGGGGIVGDSWQTHVPTTGTKTIANGDLAAFAVQATARAGADAVRPTVLAALGGYNFPQVTNYLGGTYTGSVQLGTAIIVFSDGALGWFYGSEVFSTVTTRTFASADSPNEYGQLYDLPFPYKIYGIYGIIDPDADFDVVLYSDPLGTPAAERTVAVDANTVAAAAGKYISVLFPSPYSTTANQKVAAVLKPGASNVSTYFKTLAHADHRVANAWGTSGYGVSRSGGTGAFANANSSLDHYYIGLLVGGFDDGASGGGSGLSAPLFGGGVI